MSPRDEAHRDAVALIARRLVERDEQPPADRADPDIWASAVLTELTAFGWRPTAVRRDEHDDWRAAPDRGEPSRTPAEHAAELRRLLRREDADGGGDR